MAEEWHDINSPGFSFGKKKEDPKPKKPNTGIDDSQEPPKKEPPPVEYRIKYVRPVEPKNGFRHNKAYDIEGEIEPLVEKITQPRIVLYPIGLYKGAEDNFFPNGIEVFPDKDGKFRVTCDHLFNAMDFDKDYEKPADATWILVIRAKGRTAEKDVESEPLIFPQPEKTFINLRKGHYDDNGASRYEKPQEGDDYVKGNAVKLLQQDLIALRFLPRGGDDGFFGSKTDAAVRDFQEIAIDKYRMPFRLGKLIEAESTLQQSSADGIVGPKTRDELDLWKKKEWVKPAVVLRHGDYDDDGVNNRKGEHGGDDHHIKTPVKEYQQDLQKIDAYSGALDGWFFDKMNAAVKLFQEYAEKGQFLINGVMADIGEKLTGHNKGTLDIPTQEMIKKVAQKGGKVEKAKGIRLDDKGKVVEEINIRLSGFGGGVPSDSFDAVTESKVKNFQRAYMKMKNPTGVVDEETAKAIDEFGDEYGLEMEEFGQLKCTCGKCSGFGKIRHKGEYKETTQVEAHHKYEYPGIHRSLLWGIGALKFHLEESHTTGARFLRFSSGYRCHDHAQTKSTGTTNHMGKAADILFSTFKEGKWIRPTDPGERNKTVEAVRKLCTDASGLSAQYKWPSMDRFSMETTAQGAKTWVHIDVREYKAEYLDDKYFCKTHTDMQGKQMKALWRETNP